MKDIFIFGNSGSARECYWLFRQMQEASRVIKDTYSFKGFLSWKNYPSNLKELSTYFLEDSHKHQITDTAKYIIGTGSPCLRHEIYTSIKKKGAQFFTLLHPWSDISPDLEMGEANIFHRGTSVHCNVKIGNANYFNGGINLAHDVVIGNANFIGPCSLLLGNVSLGDCNLMAVNTVCLANAKIGHNNIIAPASIIYKGCGSNCRMAGNPALKIADIQE